VAVVEEGRVEEGRVEEGREGRVDLHHHRERESVQRHQR
jgi:hypothetical protein